MKKDIPKPKEIEFNPKKLIKSVEEMVKMLKFADFQLIRAEKLILDIESQMKNNEDKHLNAMGLQRSKKRKQVKKKKRNL